MIAQGFKIRKTAPIDVQDLFGMFYRPYRVINEGSRQDESLYCFQWTIYQLCDTYNVNYKEIRLQYSYNGKLELFRILLWSEKIKIHLGDRDAILPIKQSAVYGLFREYLN